MISLLVSWGFRAETLETCFLPGKLDDVVLGYDTIAEYVVRFADLIVPVLLLRQCICSYFHCLLTCFYTQLVKPHYIAIVPCPHCRLIWIVEQHYIAIVCVFEFFFFCTSVCIQFTQISFLLLITQFQFHLITCYISGPEKQG